MKLFATDKAQSVYEEIINIDNTDAEAHWGAVLCKYGIEYVKDTNTGKHIPTCHRTQYESILTCADYLSALEYADGEQQAIYLKQAVEISRLQKDILTIVEKEEPFDVFICYKETDENGKRTVDSVLANDIYYQLTEEGFKVFYAPITLEDKIGQEYEPYIFAALNSAKVMLCLGTKKEYFNAVWVKNEWLRFIKLMKNDRSKILVPCYRDMDAYDLPEEFAHLQAQDMGKIGFINDIVRGIKKVLKKDENKDYQPKPQPKVNAEKRQFSDSTNKKSKNSLLKIGVVAFLCVFLMISSFLIVGKFLETEKNNSIIGTTESHSVQEIITDEFLNETDITTQQYNSVPKIISAKTIVGTELGVSNVDSKRTFEASNLLDGNVDTCWCVNTSKQGAEDATVEFTLSEKTTVSRIAIVNGNQYKTENGLYKSNGQVCRFMLTFSDGSNQFYTAEYNSGNPNQYQYFDLETPVVTDSITLTVISSYEGSKFNTNVAITEFDIQ